PSLPDQIVFRDTAVLEGEVRGRACPQAQLRFRLDVGHPEPGGVFRDDEERDAFVALRAWLAGVDLDEVGDAPIRDEPLLAVQDPLPSLEAGGRLQVPRIAARLRLRQRPCAEPLALRERHEPTLLLLLARE